MFSHVNQQSHKFPNISSNQWESLLRSYQQDLMVRSDLIVTLGWFVCPTVHGDY